METLIFIIRALFALIFLIDAIVSGIIAFPVFCWYQAMRFLDSNHAAQ
jgi:hypothetical protein